MTPGRRAPGVDLLALGVALAAVAAVAAAIGAPRSSADAARAAPLRAILVDTSASVTRPRPGWRRWALVEVAREAREARDAGEDVALVTFDASVQRRLGPVPAGVLVDALRGGEVLTWLEPDPETALGSDLGGAARAALDLVASGERPPGRIAVLGDGVPGSEDPSDLLLDPAVAALDLVRPGPPDLPDLAITALHAPRRVEPGAVVPVLLDLAFAGPRPEGRELELEWTLRWRGAAGLVDPVTRRGRVDGALRPDPSTDAVQRVRFELEIPPLDPGSAELEVRASLAGAGPDAFPENDALGATLTIGDAVRALLAVPEGVAPAAIGLRGPAFDGIEIVPIASTAIADALNSSPRPDALITLDLPLAGLPAADLTRFVESGGGWVRAGGWTRLRSDAPALERLAALVPDREPRPPRDIVLAVDGSGSMAGPRWDRVRGALGQLVPTVGARDRIELRLFTRALGEVALAFEAPDGGELTEPERERRRGVVSDLMRARVPGGATDIVSSLRDLARIRLRSVDPRTERTGISILLTDGLTDSAANLRDEVRERIDVAGDRLVVIQVGDDPEGTRFLEGLLRDGEALARAGELEGLLDTLQRAVEGDALVEGTRAVAAPAPAGPTWAASLAEAVNVELRLDQPLAIARALRCRPADDAVGLVGIAAEDGGAAASLVAVAERGRGTVCDVAVPWIGATDDAWCPELLGRSSWLAPVLRSMARRAEEAPDASLPARPAAALEQGGRSLAVRGLPATLPARLVAELQSAPALDVFGSLVPGATLTTVVLEPPLWDAAPARTRVGPRPAPLERLPRGTAVRLDLGAGIASIPLVAPGPLEALSAVDPTATPARAFGLADGFGATATGAPSPEGRGPHPLTPVLLGAAVVALFLGAIGFLGVIGASRSSRRRRA
ncbi:MAG: hypothetical protein AAGA20_20570 [Planctomycetota bacterium]